MRPKLTCLTSQFWEEFVGWIFWAQSSISRHARYSSIRDKSRCVNSAGPDPLRTFIVPRPGADPPRTGHEPTRREAPRNSGLPQLVRSLVLPLLVPLFHTPTRSHSFHGSCRGTHCSHSFHGSCRGTHCFGGSASTKQAPPRAQFTNRQLTAIDYQPSIDQESASTQYKNT